MDSKSRPSLCNGFVNPKMFNNSHLCSDKYNYDIIEQTWISEGYVHIPGLVLNKWSHQSPGLCLSFAVLMHSKFHTYYKINFIAMLIPASSGTY